jgi:hypothetical protein
VETVVSVVDLANFSNRSS